MKLCSKVLAIAVTAASTYSLIGCAAPPSFSYQNISVSITAACTSCGNFATTAAYNPAYPLPPNPGSVIYMPSGGAGSTGGFITFGAVITNAPPSTVTWAIYPTPNLGSIDTLPTGTTIPVAESGSSVGTIQSSGNIVDYATPNSVPIYSGAALQQAQALGIPQGDVLLVATVPGSPSDPNSVVTASQLIQVYNPANNLTPFLVPHTNTTPAGLTNPVVTVARGANFQFFGGVVGASPCSGTVTCAAQGFTVLNSSDNTPLWEVCPANFALSTCVIGGNSTLGTITQTGLYTAPAIIPNPLPIVFVTAHQTPTVSNTNNYAYIGVN